MPADIVARAKAAMRQANGPALEPTETMDHLDRDGVTDGVTEPAAVPLLTAAGEPPQPGGRASADCASAQTIHPEAADDQATAMQAPAENIQSESARAPWEMPVPRVDVTAAAEAVGSPRGWSGYNPDYVADQLVPMIHARATTGWRSWLGLPPNKAELRHKELQSAMCVNFAQPVKIVLANPRGYAGKTTLTVALAGALGLARGGRVCAFEVHELRGVMALRTVANGTQRTTRDFINDLSRMTPEQVRHADLSRYVRHQQAGNFDAMVTSRNSEKQLDGEEYRAASALLQRFYEVIVIDTANNEAHEAFRAAVEDATVLVVPTKWRPTHITPATQMLNDMAALSARHRLLVQNAVVVASNGANEAVPGARDMAMPMFTSLAHTVIEIPPDPHIEADRPILHDQLRPDTRRSLDQLGAAVCAAAMKNIHELEKLP